MPKLTLANAPFLCASLTSLAAAQATDGLDWPQWRGPARTGVSLETGWSPVGAAEPLWRRDLGLGHSSFAVVGERAYTLGYDVASGMDRVYCLDTLKGDVIWRHEYPCEIWDSAHDGGALTTPTVTGDSVYTSNREGKVFCFDAATGDVRWSRDLRKEKELEPPTWGFAASPLVAHGLVIMNVDRTVALDPETGEDRWVTDKNYGISYSTPAPFELEGRALLASLTGDGLAVLALEDGAEVAFHPWVQRPQIYPMTPVVVGDRIFISAGYERGCAMLRLVGNELTELWGGRMMRNKMSGCVLWQDHLYGFDESILTCLDLDGNRKWRERGLGTGSMTIADGRMLILDGEGHIIVAEANPAEYVELSRQQVFADGTAWSTPILSHGRVFCRSSKGAMACLDFRGAGTDSATAEAAAPLPSAAEIVARHVAALGDSAAREKAQLVRMTGAGESLRNTVHNGVVELDWSRGDGFSWRDDAAFELAHDAEAGWVLGLRSGPQLLEGDALAALREAGDLARWFDPGDAYVGFSGVRRKVFDHRPCYALDAVHRDGQARTLYFEVESGLLAGHKGDGTRLWTLAGYRSIDGVVLPTSWAFYDSEGGERSSAEFDQVAIDPEVESNPFERPPLVKLLTRSPEEIEADNARLSKLHAALIGTWQDVDEPDEPADRLLVKDGFLWLQSGPRPPMMLTEPADDGSMHLIAYSFVRIVPRKDEAGAVGSIEIWVDGELDATLEPVE